MVIHTGEGGAQRGVKAESMRLEVGASVGVRTSSYMLSYLSRVSIRIAMILPMSPRNRIEATLLFEKV